MVVKKLGKNTFASNFQEERNIRILRALAAGETWVFQYDLETKRENLPWKVQSLWAEESVNIKTRGQNDADFFNIKYT
jgi:hypothetical protein